MENSLHKTQDGGRGQNEELWLLNVIIWGVVIQRSDKKACDSFLL